MFNKPKLEAAPTPHHSLREAIAARDACVADVSELRKKSDMFAPVQAEVAAAEAALQQVMHKDIEAMQAWAEGGAASAPPEPNHKARLEASQRVATARAKLEASAGAVRQFEAQLADANQRYSETLPVVANAQRELIGNEMVRRASALKKIATDYVTAENYYFRINAALKDFGGGDAFFAETAEILRPFNATDNVAMSEAARLQCETDLQALLRGEELGE